MINVYGEARVVLVALMGGKLLILGALAAQVLGEAVGILHIVWARLVHSDRVSDGRMAQDAAGFLLAVYR